jgi:hypothetical protein
MTLEQQIEDLYSKIAMLAESGIRGWVRAYIGALAPSDTVDLSSVAGFINSAEIMVVFRKSTGYYVPIILPRQLYGASAAIALPDSTTGERCSFTLNASTYVLTNTSETGIDVQSVYFR